MWHALLFISIGIGVGVFYHDYEWVRAWQDKAILNFSKGLVEYPGDWIVTPTEVIAWDLWLNRLSSLLTIIVAVVSLIGGLTRKK
jgi:hypothetical protein